MEATRRLVIFFSRPKTKIALPIGQHFLIVWIIIQKQREDETKIYPTRANCARSFFFLFPTTLLKIEKRHLRWRLSIYAESFLWVARTTIADLSLYSSRIPCVCVCRRQRHHKKFLDDDDFLDETGRKSRILSPLCVCVDGEDSRINITRVVPYSRRYSFSGTRHSYRRMITTNFRTWWFSSFSFLKEKIHVHGKWNYLGFKFIRTNEPFLTIDK